jgi:uncharacterized protein (UPF0332 family)
MEAEDIYRDKARESLAGAESELANGRYNNCANRCYYACFQSAVYALMGAGFQPRGPRGQWGHDYVQAEFIGQLINRRKFYPSALREILERTYTLRQTADYQRDQVTETQASRAVRRAREFVASVDARGGTLS